MKFPKKLSDKSKIIYLNHCGVSPLYQGAVDAGHFFAKKHHALGINIFSKYGQILDLLHKAVASFLRDPLKTAISLLYAIQQKDCQ